MSPMFAAQARMSGASASRFAVMMARRDKPDITSDLIATLGNTVFPGVGVGAKHALGPIRSEWERSRSQALRAAESAMGMTREEVADLLAQEPKLVPLYVQILWAAGMNGHDQTLRAMGASFAAAALGGADAVDEAEMVLRALATFTPRHFAILRALTDGRLIWPESGGGPSYADYVPKAVGQRAGVSIDVARQCLMNLAAAGLATMHSVLASDDDEADTMAFPITRLGLAVIAAAEHSEKSS